MHKEQQTPSADIPSDHTPPPSPGSIEPIPDELVVGAGIDSANCLASETIERAITPENGKPSISIWDIVLHEPSKNRAVAPYHTFRLALGCGPNERLLQLPYGARNRWAAYRYGGHHPLKTLCGGCGGEIIPCPSCPPLEKTSAVNEAAASGNLGELAKNILDDMKNQTGQPACCPSCEGNTFSCPDCSSGPLDYQSLNQDLDHTTSSNPSTNSHSDSAHDIGLPGQRKQLVGCAICGANAHPCPNCSTGPFSTENANENGQNTSTNTKPGAPALASAPAGLPEANSAPQSKSSVLQSFKLRINISHLLSFVEKLMVPMVQPCV
jgi:hypothetical protein